MTVQRSGIKGLALSPALEPAALAEEIRNHPMNPEEFAQAQALLRDRQEPVFETRDNFNFDNLADAGWGVIFPQQGDPKIREILEPLLALRRRQARSRYHAFHAEDGYQMGDSASVFLESKNAALGAVDPTRMPFYILLVGSPEEISFGFQFQLDLRHAVGRLYFDNYESYEKYVEGVLAHEGDLEREEVDEQSLVLFGTRNPGDEMSMHMASFLVEPLARALRHDTPPQWTIDEILGTEATAERLKRLFSDEVPDLLFTACHGCACGPDSPEQNDYQGAILCQDRLFSAKDLNPEGHLQGLITIHFGCHSAGVPQRDHFSNQSPKPDLASRPFIARLPQGLLGHPNGGALAVLAHVDKAWSLSYAGVQGTRQIDTFEDLIRRLMKGRTVGYAKELLDFRFAQFAAELSILLDTEELSDMSLEERNDLVLDLGTATRDARNYVVLGDPAVRLRKTDPA